MTEITLTPSAELEARLSRIVAAENHANDLESAALFALLIGLDHWETRTEQTWGREERGGVRPRPMARPGDPPQGGSGVPAPTALFGCPNCCHTLTAPKGRVFSCPECAKQHLTILMGQRC